MSNSHLVISNQTELVRVHARHILYILADGNYSYLHLTGGEVRMVSMQVGQLEQLIAAQLPELRGYFIRIGKSLIINRNYVYYISVQKQQLVMADVNMNTNTINPSKEALKELKAFIEKTELL